MCDVFAFFSSALLILVYYGLSYRKNRIAPLSSVHNVNAQKREQWVLMIMQSGKQEILAIQTLRNSLMAASFMATTVMLLISALLNLGEKIGQYAQSLHPLLTHCQQSSTIWQLKLAALLLGFAIAFYFFAMAIRFFNHVGYMINLPYEDATYQQTCAYLNKAGSYYTRGTRAFFFGLPMIAWFFDPLFLLLGTIGLIIGLKALDSVPH